MKLTSFGAGNMAQAILLGAKKKNFPLECRVYSPSGVSAHGLAEKISGKVLEDLRDISGSDYYLIACKPQQFPDLAKVIMNKIPRESVVISLMAGINVENICRALMVKKVARIMPNTPSLVGEGMNTIFYMDTLSAGERTPIEKLMETVGKYEILEAEDQVDLVTPVNGSGPAYFFEFARIFETVLIDHHIERKKARILVAQTMKGAAEMLLDDQASSAEELRERVTSKKGVTFEALEVFKQEGLEKIFRKAVAEAWKRNRELMKGE